jgi:hypothetical protein
LIVFVVVIVQVPLTSILTVFLIQINCMPGNYVLLGFYMLLHCVLFHNDDDPDSYSKLCRCSVCLDSMGWLGTLECAPNPPGATCCLEPPASG